jgi:hypothetical protein
MNTRKEISKEPVAAKIQGTNQGALESAMKPWRVVLRRELHDTHLALVASKCE